MQRIAALVAATVILSTSFAAIAQSGANWERYSAVADSDRDGAVDRYEHSAFLSRQFDVSDADNNGAIEPGEPSDDWCFCRGCSYFNSDDEMATADADGNGVVDEREHFNYHMKHFSMVDADRDGRVTATEWDHGAAHQ